MLSIIIPTLNEGNNIDAAIRNIRTSIKTDHYEIIVVDGGSTDNTLADANALCDQVLHSPPGRGTQLNIGAQAAQGEILLFLHADTQLPQHFDQMITEGILGNPDHGWGHFDLKLSGQRIIFRIVESLINWRSRITSVATGDQCLFMTKDVFAAVNGFSNIPLMEDVDISKRLKKQGKPTCISSPVITSSRRWEQKGVVRTILLMWWLRLLFFLGTSPETLKRLYT